MPLFQQSQRYRIPNTANYYRQLAGELQKIPGTESEPRQSAPAFNFEATKSVSTVGLTVPALYDSVAPEFFHLLRVPIAEGREFGWQDDETAPRVAVLSETLVLRLFPHEDAVGRKVDFGESEQGKGLTVVGVVRDANFWKAQTQHPMAIYLPLMQVNVTVEPSCLDSDRSKAAGDRSC